MSGELAHVRLVGLPVDVHRRTSEHQEAVRRELAFVDEAGASDTVPARLAALAAELSARFSGHTIAPTSALAEAVAAGERTIDLDFDLPADAADASDRLAAMLDEVDEYCRAGQLLTLVTPPDLLAYRRWFLREFAEQIRDRRSPEPWAPVAGTPQVAPDAVDVGGATIAPGDDGRAVTVTVDDELDMALAARLRGELVALIEGGSLQVVVDLERCPFVDSTGLSLLITAHARLDERAGRLRIAGATGAVRRTFERAGVLDLLGVE